MKGGMLEIGSTVKNLKKSFVKKKYIYNLEINNPSSFVLCLHHYTHLVKREVTVRIEGDTLRMAEQRNGKKPDP